MTAKKTNDVPLPVGMKAWADAGTATFKMAFVVFIGLILLTCALVCASGLGGYAIRGLVE